MDLSKAAPSILQRPTHVSAIPQVGVRPQPSPRGSGARMGEPDPRARCRATLRRPADEAFGGDLSLLPDHTLAHINVTQRMT